MTNVETTTTEETAAIAAPGPHAAPQKATRKKAAAQRKSVRKGQKIMRITGDNTQTLHTVTRIDGYEGLKKIELEEAVAGDIVSISGVTEVKLGDSLCDP